MPNQAYNLPSVETETSTIKKVVCPPTATTINLKFEGEALPLEYDKYAIVTTKFDLGIADDVHLLYLKNEANQSCANQILFLKSEELVYTQHRLDNPLTLIDKTVYGYSRLQQSARKKSSNRHKLQNRNYQ